MASSKVVLPPEIAKFDFHSKLGFVALKAFFRICSDWNTTIDEQMKLLNVGLIELEDLRKTPATPLKREQLVRIRCFVLVYKSLVGKYSSIPRANREVRAPKSGQPFFGKSPLHLMLNGHLIGIATACKAISGEVPEVEGFKKAS
ncbi:DUF2384 domain-containing protein [Marinobacter sp. F3R08]|uniref:DUF2384 domain-containing protein n=1 Tax=Marinobacter sp. F3R08 TaxID=2841559 RepID=UPI001C094827|nr:DUF2384 domain-containing protein [Marinobacter sp. F3R08]MBU2952206.1 DUF2384 domain-containing protein [Marinobacter sp. F3R08]